MTKERIELTGEVNRCPVKAWAAGTLRAQGLVSSGIRGFLYARVRGRALSPSVAPPQAPPPAPPHHQAPALCRPPRPFLRQNLRMENKPVRSRFRWSERSSEEAAPPGKSRVNAPMCLPRRPKRIEANHLRRLVVVPAWQVEAGTEEVELALIGGRYWASMVNVKSSCVGWCSEPLTRELECSIVAEAGVVHGGP